jgi:predicted ATPase
MITSLQLENLKCFDRLHLGLGQLTLLTGFNAAGKSTALQSLLLLSQSLRGRGRGQSLVLNGNLALLGSPAEVLNGGAKALTLGAANGDAALAWRFQIDEESRRSLILSELAVTDESGMQSLVTNPQELHGLELSRPNPGAAHLLQTIESTVFLSAARQVENEVFQVPTDAGQSRGDVGVIGQFAPWWLYQEGDLDIPVVRRCRAAAEGATLRQQVNAWCDELFPGAEVDAQPVPKTRLMRLVLRSGTTSEWTTPANIGFGISYAFPILLAGLWPEPKGPLVLDSPEAHLHPQGQSRIGGFLAQMASAGSQILVETHSDHLLNGVRIALRNGVIRPDQVIVYFFGNRPEARVTRLSVDKNGNVSDWPEGFFDQSEKDLSTLAGWS